MSTKLNNNEFTRIIDISRPSYDPIILMQGSHNAYTLNFMIFDNGIPMSLQTDVNIMYRLEGATPDKRYILRDAKAVSNYTVTFDNINEYLTCMYGDCILHIVLYDDENKKTIQLQNDIIIHIKENTLLMSNIINSDDYSTFNNTILSIRSIITDTLGINDKNISNLTAFSSNKTQNLVDGLQNQITTVNNNLDAGYDNVSVSNTGLLTTHINFHKSFRLPPIVVLTALGGNKGMVDVTIVENSISTTGFDVYGYYSGANGTVKICWQAILG